MSDGLYVARKLQKYVNRPCTEPKNVRNCREGLRLKIELSDELYVMKHAIFRNICTHTYQIDTVFLWSCVTRLAYSKLCTVNDPALGRDRTDIYFPSTVFNAVRLTPTVLAMIDSIYRPRERNSRVTLTARRPTAHPPAARFRGWCCTAAPTPKSKRWVGVETVF